MEERCDDTAGIVLQSDVGVVLVKETEWWGIPKGRVDHGETPLEAAIRETIEEVSILVTKEGSHINLFNGNELCIKAEGGPTCLTRAILESFFSFLICMSFTGFRKDLSTLTSTATNCFVGSVGSG